MTDVKNGGNDIRYDFRLKPELLNAWLTGGLCEPGDLLEVVKVTDGELTMIALRNQRTHEIYICGEHWEPLP